jgi:tetratricopeptide (TPR) repeat protein
LAKKKKNRGKFTIFKPIAVLLLIAGFFTIVSSVEVFILKSNAAYGTLVGVVLILIYFIVGGLLIGQFRAIYRTEVGSYRGIFNALLFTILAQAFLLYTNWNVINSVFYKVNWNNIVHSLETNDAFVFFILNLAFFVIEIVSLLLVIRKKQMFMPSEAEVQATLRRFGGQLVKTVSECPKCHAVVEKDWILCPECGTALPRACAKCGTDLHGAVAKCPNCGTEVVSLETLNRSIDTLKGMAEQEATPEARSVRYAKLAEAYLKAGYLDTAVETYRKAIHYTEFTRKQSNFMVKMATVLDSAGKEEEAQQILGAALELDPEDAAGASALKKQIEAHNLYAAAMRDHKANHDADAVAKLAQAIELDPQDAYGEKALRGEIEALDLIQKAKDAQALGNTDQAIELLQQAVKADVKKKTAAAAELEKLAPKGKKRK